MRILLFILLLAGCQTIQPVEPPEPLKGDRERFVAFFMDATFGEKGQPEQSDQFNRWHVPVKLMIDDSALFAEDRIIEAMDRISAVTGVPYERVSFTERHVIGALRVEAWNRNRIKTERNANCFSDSLFYERIGAIDVSHAVFPSDWPEMSDICVWEELVQTFGLMNDTLAYRNKTMFYEDYHGIRRPTNWDWLGLWLTYHPDLKPGMSREEVEPIVRRIVGAL